MPDRDPVRITKTQLEEQRQYMEQVRALPNCPRSFHVVTYGCQMNAHDS